MIGTTITVYREDEPVEVELEGRFSHQESYNPRETGPILDDWDVIAPKGFELTATETMHAIQALYDEQARD